MKIKEGHVYYICDDYYKLTQDCNVKGKSRKGNNYPAYCCRMDEDTSFIWMIPMSLNTEKHQIIHDKEINKYGHCFSIAFGLYGIKNTAFQIQNACPVKKKNIDSEHRTVSGSRILIKPHLKNEIREKFEKMLELHNNGVKCFLTDIDRIRQIISPQRV